MSGKWGLAPSHGRCQTRGKRCRLGACPLFPCHFGLGKIAVLRHEHELAVRHFSKALLIQPNATFIHYQLAMACAENGDYDGRDARATTLSAIPPDEPPYAQSAPTAVST